MKPASCGQSENTCSIAVKLLIPSLRMNRTDGNCWRILYTWSYLSDSDWCSCQKELRFLHASQIVELGNCVRQRNGKTQMSRQLADTLRLLPPSNDQYWLAEELLQLWGNSYQNDAQFVFIDSLKETSDIEIEALCICALLNLPNCFFTYVGSLPAICIIKRIFSWTNFLCTRSAGCSIIDYRLVRHYLLFS